jgi:hypothetical protein
MSGGIPITDPVELAWCAFARKREEKWRPIEDREQGVSIASFEAGAAWERAACAELARAAGCLCVQLHAFLQESTGIRLSQVSQIDSVVDVHDPRCPAAILAAIEGRGRA